MGLTLTAILLGIVEGLTEFIPVSSTGHLVLAGELLGFDSDAAGTFEIVIQLGAILAVIVLYWRRFWDVFVGLGVERKSAAEFSFFVAVPTMLAASGYDLLKSGAALGRDDWLTIAIGFAVSFVVALLVIKWFIGIVSRRGFAPFAWYRIVVGCAALAWLTMR